jgi:hypothetical protein
MDQSQVSLIFETFCPKEVGAISAFFEWRMPRKCLPGWRSKLECPKAGLAVLKDGVDVNYELHRGVSLFCIFLLSIRGASFGS